MWGAIAGIINKVLEHFTPARIMASKRTKLQRFKDEKNKILSKPTNDRNSKRLLFVNSRIKQLQIELGNQ